jgi:hypothetical protein
VAVTMYFLAICNVKKIIKYVLALYNGASGEGTFLALANSLQFSASGGGKFAAARGIRLQRASSDVYRAEI